MQKAKLLNKIYTTQECIPVGCVLTAAVADTRCQTGGGNRMTGDTVLFENNRVAPEWVCNPFSSDSIVIVRNSCGKVMFLHRSVSHSVHGGDVCPCGGRTPLLGIHRSLPKTATAAYGTHPTGMHTYFSMKTVSLASLQN